VFCERQDALYVEFVNGLGTMVDLGQRQFFAQLVALPLVACRIASSCSRLCRSSRSTKCTMSPGVANPGWGATMAPRVERE
jgi:hypothetical protein